MHWEHVFPHYETRTLVFHQQTQEELSTCNSSTVHSTQLNGVFVTDTPAGQGLALSVHLTFKAGARLTTYSIAPLCGEVDNGNLHVQSN